MEFYLFPQPKVWFSLSPTATKIKTAQQHYIRVSRTEFHPNRSRNKGSTGRHIFTPLSISATEPIFNKPTLAGQLFVKNTYTKFHENPKFNLVADDRSQTDRRCIQPCVIFFLILNELLKTEKSAWANYWTRDALSRNVVKQLPTLCNTPVKQRPQLHHSGSLKPRIFRFKQHRYLSLITKCWHDTRQTNSTALPGVVDVRGVRGVPGTSSSLSPPSSFHDTDRSWEGATFLGDTTARSTVPFMLVTRTWDCRLSTEPFAHGPISHCHSVRYVTADAIDTGHNQSQSSHYSDYSSFLLFEIFSIGL